MIGLQSYWIKPDRPIDKAIPVYVCKAATAAPPSPTVDPFKPVLFLLMLSGTDIRGSCRRPITLCLSLLFHVACLGIIALKTACLARAFRWHVLVTVTMKVTALLLWWVVNSRKVHLRRLMDAVGGGDRRSRLLSVMKTASYFVLAFMWIQPALLSVRFFDETTMGGHPTCVLLQVGGWLQVVMVLLHEFASVYVNCSITYALALMYVACCRAYSAEILQSRLTLLKTFEKVLQVFRTIEDVLSPCILVVFAHLLFSLFKDMVVLIYVFDNHLFLMIPAYVLDFLTNALLTTAVVICAEGVQGRADDLREKLLVTQPQEVSYRQYVKVVDDRHRLRLTAWGMFDLKKPLLLTIGAWLVTYGVIILQFSSTPG